MECFAVLMEWCKSYPPLPKPEDLGFLCDCRYVTPEVQAQAIIKSKGPIDTIVQLNGSAGGESRAEEKPKVDYYWIHLLCDAINILLEENGQICLREQRRRLHGKHSLDMSSLNIGAMHSLMTLVDLYMEWSCWKKITTWTTTFMLEASYKQWKSGKQNQHIEWIIQLQHIKEAGSRRLVEISFS